MAKIWKYTKYGSPGDKPVAAPLSYRSWKWIWQNLTPDDWEADLFARLDDTDWDLVILLDACRYDSLNKITEEAVVDKAISPASATPEFLEKSYEADVFDNCVYLSANPQTEKQRPGKTKKDVALYQQEWDDKLSTVAPSAVYERAKQHLRKDEKVVAHTLQPHYPHVCEINDTVIPLPQGLHPLELDTDITQDDGLQQLLASGVVDIERAKKSYERSVRFAWEKAKTFAASMAAEGYKVVVTSDHGELFGEWGFVEHPVNIKTAKLVEIPWIVFRPHDKQNANILDSTQDRLAALGYVQK